MWSQNYSVVLLVPDVYERPYVRDLANLLLVTMGFKQICVQQVGKPVLISLRVNAKWIPQESLAATYGAGISSACVVDIGALNTSIACVDEGMVVADTRYFNDAAPSTPQPADYLGILRLTDQQNIFEHGRRRYH